MREFGLSKGNIDIIWRLCFCEDNSFSVWSIGLSKDNVWSLVFLRAIQLMYGVLSF